jgi:hypothetical protein
VCRQPHGNEPVEEILRAAGVALIFVRRRGVGDSMFRFKTGDRVEVVGDIARFLNSKIGLITSDSQRSISVLKEFAVTLADGTRGTFFDFQLRIPPCITARMAFDSITAGMATGMRGGGFNRQLRFVAQNFDLHISVAASGQNRNMLGQLIWGSKTSEGAVISLLVDDEVIGTTTTDKNGEFRLRDVPAGPVNLEVLVPSGRITSPLVV